MKAASDRARRGSTAPSQRAATLVALALLLVSCSSLGAQADPSASPEPSGSASASASPAPSASPLPSPSAGGSPSASPTTDASPVASPSSEPSPSASHTPSASLPAASPSPLATPSPAPTAPGDETPDLAQAGWYHVENNDDGASFTLYVGRLDGRVHEALTAPSGILGSGPVDGKVLAYWRERGETVMVLVDTADGAVTELLRTSDRFGGAALHPSGEHWYWSPLTVEDRIDGLWRRPVTGGPAERVMDHEWSGIGAMIDFALDGDRVAVSTFHFGDEGYDYRFLDLASGDVSEVLGTGHRSPLGFLGRELVVYVADRGDAEIHLPLIAIDPDGSQRVIVDGEGTYATIVADAEGSPVLLHDSHETEAYRLYALADGEPEAHLVYEGEGPSYEPPARMVASGNSQGIEVSGWIGVLPRGVAYIRPDRLDERPDVPRLLVNLADGSIIELPELSTETGG